MSNDTIGHNTGNSHVKQVAPSEQEGSNQGFFGQIWGRVVRLFSGEKTQQNPSASSVSQAMSGPVKQEPLKGDDLAQHLDTWRGILASKNQKYGAGAVSDTKLNSLGNRSLSDVISGAIDSKVKLNERQIDAIIDDIKTGSKELDAKIQEETNNASASTQDPSNPQSTPTIKEANTLEVKQNPNFSYENTQLALLVLDTMGLNADSYGKLSSAIQTMPDVNFKKLGESEIKSFLQAEAGRQGINLETKTFLTEEAVTREKAALPKERTPEADNHMVLRIMGRGINTYIEQQAKQNQTPKDSNKNV